MLEWLLSELAKDADGVDGDADRFRRTERFLLELANLGFHSMFALRQDFVLRASDPFWNRTRHREIHDA